MIRSIKGVLVDEMGNPVDEKHKIRIYIEGANITPTLLKEGVSQQGEFKLFTDLARFTGILSSARFTIKISGPQLVADFVHISSFGELDNLTIVVPYTHLHQSMIRSPFDDGVRERLKSKTPTLEAPPMPFPRLLGPIKRGEIPSKSHQSPRHASLELTSQGHGEEDSSSQLGICRHRRSGTQRERYAAESSF